MVAPGSQPACLPAIQLITTACGCVHAYFGRNNEDKYHCPVTYKVFNENTQITAIATTGNVYSFEAINDLCIKVCSRLRVQYVMCSQVARYAAACVFST